MSRDNEIIKQYAENIVQLQKAALRDAEHEWGKLFHQKDKTDRDIIKQSSWYFLMAQINVQKTNDIIDEIHRELNKEHNDLQKVLNIFYENKKNELERKLNERRVKYNLAVANPDHRAIILGKEVDLRQAIQEKDFRLVLRSIKNKVEILLHHIWYDVKYFLNFKEASKARIALLVLTAVATIFPIPSKIFSVVGIVLPEIFLLSQTIAFLVTYGNLIYAAGLLLFTAIEVFKIFQVQREYKKKIAMLHREFNKKGQPWRAENEFCEHDFNLRRIKINQMNIDEVLAHPEAIRLLFTETEFHAFIRYELKEHTRREKNKAIFKHGYFASLFAVMCILACSAFIFPQVALPLAALVIITFFLGIGIKALIDLTLLKPEKYTNIPGINPHHGKCKRPITETASKSIIKKTDTLEKEKTDEKKQVRFTESIIQDVDRPLITTEFADIRPDGLKPGDIVFFHVGNKTATSKEKLIRIGNAINRNPTGLNHSAVHVEVVSRIDDKGEAFLMGMPGHNKALREKSMTQILEEKKGHLDAVSIARPISQSQGMKVASTAYALHKDRQINYSLQSCAIAALPTSRFLSRETFNSPKMMCSEFVGNLLHKTDKPSNSIESSKIPKSRVAPGKLRERLSRSGSGFVVSNEIKIVDGKFDNQTRRATPSFSS